MQIEFTQKEVEFILEIINTVNFSGKSIEEVYNIKLKIKSALGKQPKVDAKE